MKFDDLRSIAHNIADSLASGIGLLIGVYQMDVFGEAARSPEGFITVDFLTGTSSGGKVSPSLARAICRYREGLADLCRKHRASPAAFRELTVRYSPYGRGGRFVVTVEDQRGRRSVDEYEAWPGRRIRTFDHLGRIRTNRRRYDA
ncbi:MAG TPA: hypothetical protein VN823_07560 [Stellaceae bacterium]|nr:hypothetical protein [Stellaceae bacterium]